MPNLEETSNFRFFFSTPQRAHIRPFPTLPLSIVPSPKHLAEAITESLHERQYLINALLEGDDELHILSSEAHFLKDELDKFSNGDDAYGGGVGSRRYSDPQIALKERFRRKRLEGIVLRDKDWKEEKRWTPWQALNVEGLEEVMLEATLKRLAGIMEWEEINGEGGGREQG